MDRRLGLLTCAAFLLVPAGVARAQSAPTCTFDPATAHVTVATNGSAAGLRAVTSTGEIRLDGTFVNADGYAETVDCGPGAADDPQPSALDTFIGCEEI